MDPLSQIISLLKPQAVGWRVIEAHDAWTITFRPSNVVVFGQMIEGVGHVEREDGITFDLTAGDFLLMAAPPNWTMAGLGGGKAVDFKALIDNPGPLLSANPSVITRFIAGNFIFDAANRDLIATLMLPIVHVKSSAVEATRLGTLLATLGDEALADRPGRSLVLDRLLEVIMIESLREG